ncbi:hypothetical protein [Streptomyces sp. HUAS ZL42]|uniref:hypothetical protein n=1 Tax=Streptomyces sp. HUAS ZL42 TaxID=3231715 RepID=UPI00345E0B74
MNATKPADAAAPTHRKRVLVICELDGYSNTVRPTEIHRFLRRRGHEVHLFDVADLAVTPSAGSLFGRRLPGPRPRQVALYATEAVSSLITRHGGPGRRFLSYYALTAGLSLRRALLRARLPLDAFDLVMCVHPCAAEVLTGVTSARTWYDCPTPFSDELYNEGKLTDRQHRRLRRREIRLLEKVDVLSYFWVTYAQYAVEHYGISGRNMVRLDWGCDPSPERAHFAAPPRIVYLGSLSSRFIDLPLLARLSQRYPIDVYGGPPPDPRLGLRYRGYASADVVKNYQFGLITCTRDALRSNGFSAKHPQYLAYGLPVLVPAWRNHLELLKGSVPYTEETFTDVIDSLAVQHEWQSASDQAYTQAQQLSWDMTLRPLESVLADDTTM